MSATRTRAADPVSNFGYLLKDLSRLYSRNFERHSSPLGLTLAHCKVLTYLRRHAGVSQARLALLTDTDPMTLARLLVKMEADGLVERRADAADRRVRSLHLGPGAAAVLDEIHRLSLTARAESLAGLSQAERADLMKLMHRVQANLDTLVPVVADHPPRAASN